MNYVDMHMHSTYSDGEYTVQDLFSEAGSRGLKAIVLTDHDCFDGYDEAVRYGSEFGIETITGAEISTMYNQKEIHLLAYGFDPTHRMLIHQLKRVRESRVERAEKIVKNLKKHFSITIDLNRVIELGGENPGRPHIAKVLVEKGYVQTHQQAFDKYLHGKSKVVESKLHLDIERMIKTIHNANGVCAIAHCGRYFSKSQLKQLIKWGMDGIEIFHPSHNDDLIAELMSLADEFNLLKTGGSDFHGKRLYSEIGSQKVDSLHFELLLERLN